MRVKHFVATLIILTGSLSLNAQDFGLSFSYFLPKNGYFSTPISPFSIRGLGFDLSRYVALETGASLYRMSGMNLKNVSFSSKKPLIGPNFTLLVPGEIVFGLRGQRVEFELKGGGFFFYCFDNKIQYGNVDEAIRNLEGWDIADANFTYENSPGFGYHGGAEILVYVTSQLGISLETNYLVGYSRFPLKGTYTGGTSGGSNTLNIETVDVDEADARIDFTGLEFSVGIVFSSNRGPARPARRRR